MFTHLFRILKYGTSYAIATGFFPKETAKKVLLLYSFVRIPDNIVDEVNCKPQAAGHKLQTKENGNLKTKAGSLNNHYQQAKTKLETLKNSRIQAYTNNRREDSQRGQYVSLFQDNSIPFQYSLDFFKAMIDDCSIHRYETYKQLEGYMYGSASVVGLMMCHIIGFTDIQHEEEAKKYAIELGNAMQLTNFLRDIREDYEELGRIYVPLSMDCFVPRSDDHSAPQSNSSWGKVATADEAIHTIHNDITSFCHGGYAKASEDKKKARDDTMKVYITKCRTMYDHSISGIQYLQPEGRKAVRLAAILYESILDKIERNHYDVFTKSARTTLWDKCKILLR